MRRLTVLVCAAALAACAGRDTTVARVVDDRTILGRWVAPEAYQLFLRGAISESAGNVDDAIAAYDALVTWDDADPEVFARLAMVRCTKNPADPAAKVALDRAFALDPAYGPAFEARARCGGGPADLGRAAAAEPRWLPLQIAAASLGDGNESALLSITMRFATAPAAWEALATYAFAHGARALGVHAALELARLSPMRVGVLHRFAATLAGDGALTEARRVAAAAVDARDDQRRGGAPAPPALVARLALDDALVRGDAALALHRAAAGRVLVAEAAARALLLGQRATADELAKMVASADPADAEARLVMVALAPGAGTAPPVAPAPVSAAACAVYLRAIATRDGTLAARRAAAPLRCEAMIDGDGIVARVQADLAARDVVAEEAIGAEARIELCARRGDKAIAFDVARVDRRHALLASALRGEEIPRGLTDDPLLAAAQLISQSKRSAPIGDDERTHAESIAKDDALLTAALVAVVSPEKKPALRARLLSIAATDAERRLARD